MIVLGVDPGLTRCGVGVVQSLPGRRVRLLHVDVIRTPREDDLALRLLAIHDQLEAVVEAHRPDVVAVERVFSQANLTSVMGTAQASGVAVLVGARLGIPVVTHTPTEVKAAVTGSGSAGKAQVTAMVTRILSLDTPPRPADAADALALAICQIWRGTPASGHGSARLTPAQRAWQNAAAEAATRRRAWRT